MKQELRMPPFLVAGLLLVAVGAWQLFVALSVALAAQAAAAQGGTDLMTPERFALAFALRPGVLAASVAAVAGGVLLVAELARAMHGWTRAEVLDGRSGAGLADGRSGAWLAVAVVAGGAVAVVGGWLGDLLDGHGPFDGTQMRAVADALRAGGAPTAVLVGAVVLVAPVAEELLFRGVLWRVLAQRLGRRAVWLLTSALFALWHLDALQVAALVPAALTFGALRMRGGVGAAVLAHAAHNAVAVGLALVGSDAG